MCLSSVSLHSLASCSSAIPCTPVSPRRERDNARRDSAAPAPSGRFASSRAPPSATAATEWAAHWCARQRRSVSAPSLACGRRRQDRRSVTCRGESPMTGPSDEVQRDVLPIPDRPFEGTLPFDAKDPDASFPAIEPLRPPAGAPNVLVILLDDVGFAASSAFGGPCATPTAERLAGNGLKYNRFHTTALCAPTRAALADRAQPPLGGDGGHHRARHLGARVQLDSPQYLRAAGADAAAERLFDGAVRQVPRGAGLADEPDGPLRCLADRRRRLRVLLRLHRRRDEPVLPGRSTRARRRSSPRRRRRRATTSPRT